MMDIAMAIRQALSDYLASQQPTKQLKRLVAESGGAEAIVNVVAPAAEACTCSTTSDQLQQCHVGSGSSVAYMQDSCLAPIRNCDCRANPGTDYEATYKTVYDDTIARGHLLIDWAQNNLDWVDVQPFATQIKPPTPGYHDDWCEGICKMEVEEVPHA